MARISSVHPGYGAKQNNTHPKHPSFPRHIKNSMMIGASTKAKRTASMKLQDLSDIDLCICKLDFWVADQRSPPCCPIQKCTTKVCRKSRPPLVLPPIDVVSCMHDAVLHKTSWNKVIVVGSSSWIQNWVNWMGRANSKHFFLLPNSKHGNLESVHCCAAWWQWWSFWSTADVCFEHLKKTRHDHHRLGDWHGWARYANDSLEIFQSEPVRLCAVCASVCCRKVAESQCGNTHQRAGVNVFNLRKHYLSNLVNFVALLLVLCTAHTQVEQNTLT